MTVLAKFHRTLVLILHSSHGIWYWSLPDTKWSCQLPHYNFSHVQETTQEVTQVDSEAGHLTGAGIITGKKTISREHRNTAETVWSYWLIIEFYNTKHLNWAGNKPRNCGFSADFFISPNKNFFFFSFLKVSRIKYRTVQNDWLLYLTQTNT